MLPTFPNLTTMKSKTSTPRNRSEAEIRRVFGLLGLSTKADREAVLAVGRKENPPRKDPRYHVKMDNITSVDLSGDEGAQLE